MSRLLPVLGHAVSGCAVHSLDSGSGRLVRIALSSQRGLNPGWSDIHARIYDREDDLRTVLASREGIGPSHTGLLSIADHKTHYQTVYQRHNQNVREFFAGMPQRLFFGRLEDPQTFIDLCDFAGVRHNPSIAIPRSNARTAEMAERLAHHRARMDR